MAIKEDFSPETDGQGYIFIISLVWKVCCNSLGNTRNEASIKGIKKGSVYRDNYEDGVAYIHLANMEKHVKVEGLLDWAKKK